MIIIIIMFEVVKEEKNVFKQPKLLAKKLMKQIVNHHLRQFVK